MTDHADFVSFSAASHTACRCGVSHGQGLGVSASREGERSGSTARLPAEGSTLPPVPAQQRAQGEPEQGGSSGGNGGCNSCPLGRATHPLHLNTPAPLWDTFLPVCMGVQTSASCRIPICAAHAWCKPLPEVPFKLFKQIAGCSLVCTVKAWVQEIFLPTLVADQIMFKKFLSREKF